MIKEETLKKYRETITLLQYRHPNCSFAGEFVVDSEGKKALKLSVFKNGFNGGLRRKTFKYMDSEDAALMYFIKMAQNRVF